MRYFHRGMITHYLRSFSVVPNTAGALERFICKETNAILPVRDDDTSLCPFSVFALEPTFDIDVTSLEKTYKLMQKQLHPDLLSSRSPHERDAAVAHSTLINDSYEILKKPYERAKALLATENIDVGESGESISDPALLMEIMEVREHLEEVGECEEARRAIGEENKKKIEGCEASLLHYFNENDFDAATTETMRLRYLTTVHNEVYGLL
eukprot:g3339.t1